MKRTMLTVISICLVLASIFGICAAGAGIKDVSEILRFKNNQKADIADFVAVLEDCARELDAMDKDRSEDELQYAKDVVTEKEGSAQLQQGQEQYNAGAAQIQQGQEKYDSGLAQYNSAKAQYDAAEALYNQKLAEYNAAEKKLADGEAQLADAKAQRDEGQAKLDRLKPVYDAAKRAENSPVQGVLDGILQAAGLQTMSQLLAAYEAAQAQIDDASVRIEDAEHQIADGKIQLADAKVQLENGRKQLDAAKAELDKGKAELDKGKAELDKGKAELANAKDRLDAGQQALNDTADEMNRLKESLKEADDARKAMNDGVKLLMEVDGISEKVEDESDYRSVLDAAREYLDEDSAGVTDELDLRQSLYKFLRIVSIIGVAAGIIGAAAALKPGYALLVSALAANAVTAAGAAAVNIYGFLNGYGSFVYALEDGSGSGAVQRAALIVLLIVAVISAIIAAVCLNSYKTALRAETEEEASEVPPAEAEKAECEQTADCENDEPAAKTADEETERLIKELEDAKTEYEEALKGFEQSYGKAGK